MALNDAVLVFNDGQRGKLEVIKLMTGRAGVTCKRGLEEIDEDRIRRAEFKYAQLQTSAAIDDAGEDSDDDDNTKSQDGYGAGLH